jgi:hypothetical protein
MLKYFIDKKYEFTNDQTVKDTGCSLRRPDFTFDLGSGILIIENDENQHKSRACECEQTRMIQIHQDYGGIPVHFIRFNPDRYKGTGEKPLASRLKFLGETIDRIKKDNDFFIRNTNLTVSYLYYDSWDGIWSIHKIEYFNK